MIASIELQRNSLLSSLLKYFLWEFVENTMENLQQISVGSDQKKLEVKFGKLLG